ncbi:MAG: hypothetical protein ABFS16_13595 [Bacteroidota bacterium]
MYKTCVKYLLLFGGLLIFQACSTSITEKTLVAEVGDKKLYLSDISEILPENTGREDSILMTNDYINKWIKQELLIQKADENLTPAQKNVTKELQEYRNSLIIYKYKNELIKQHMDTVATDAQVEEYYNSHSSDFHLTRNIVKAVFIKIPNELANKSILKELVNDTSEDGLHELRDYCVQYAKGFDIFIDDWVDFQVLSNNMPTTIENSERFLSSNKLIEMNDANYYYLVSIHDFKLKNDLAPADYVENNIKNLILNQRKLEFLKEIEENVYKEGIRQNKFRIYNKKKDETN